MKALLKRTSTMVESVIMLINVDQGIAIVIPIHAKVYPKETLVTHMRSALQEWLADHLTSGHSVPNVCHWLKLVALVKLILIVSQEISAGGLRKTKANTAMRSIALLTSPLLFGMMLSFLVNLLKNLFFTMAVTALLVLPRKISTDSLSVSLLMTKYGLLLIQMIRMVSRYPVLMSAIQMVKLNVSTKKEAKWS